MKAEPETAHRVADIFGIRIRDRTCNGDHPRGGCDWCKCLTVAGEFAPLAGAEITETRGYEWRWATTTEQSEKYVAVKTADETRPALVLCRIEQWTQGFDGGTRVVPVRPSEIKGVEV